MAQSSSETHKGSSWPLLVLLVAVVGSLAAAFVLSLWGGRPQVDKRVYVVGTDNAYPYHFLDERGKPDGMAAEVMEEAARRTGIRLTWRLHPEGPARACGRKMVDLWPLLYAPFSPAPGIHITRPYLRNSFVAVSIGAILAKDGGFKNVHSVALLGHAAKDASQEPLVATTVFRALAKKAFPNATAAPRGSRAEVLSAVCSGDADVALLEARMAQHLALDRPSECAQKALDASGSNLPDIGLAIGSSQQSAPVADRLRDEIDKMLDDGTMARLMHRWSYYYSGEAETLFREDQALAANRLSRKLAAALALLSILLLALFLRVRRARRVAVAAGASKSRFLDSISHEIRTPLHGIIGLSQILSGTRLREEQQEFVEMIHDSGRTLLGLVDDLLDLSRTERGNFELRPVAVEPARLIAEIVRVFQVQARNKGLLLACTGLETLPPHVLADAARLRQVLGNLLSNALKFTHRGSITVDVRADTQPDSALLHVAVADTGIGISKASKGNLFKKFFQADTSVSSRSGGTGLGLAIVKELVEAMSGDIGVESELGCGSTFWFTVPLPIPDDATGGVGRSQPPQRVPLAGKTPSGTPAPASILLVEDNAVNRMIAERFLLRAGHKVTVAGDGEEAVRKWSDQPFERHSHGLPDAANGRLRGHG